MDINYFAAIGYALIGWVVQVTVYYFKFDTDEAFDKAKFWRTYDKYIILGLVSAIAIALMGDYGWEKISEKFNIGLHYDERVNIPLGIVSCLIILWFSRNANKKLE